MRTAMMAATRAAGLRPHHSSKAMALLTMPEETLAIASIDSRWSAQPPRWQVLDNSRKIQPAVCRAIPVCAWRAARFTRPIKYGKATAMINRLSVMVMNRDDTSILSTHTAFKNHYRDAALFITSSISLDGFATWA